MYYSYRSYMTECFVPARGVSSAPVTGEILRGWWSAPSRAIPPAVPSVPVAKASRSVKLRVLEIARAALGKDPPNQERLPLQNALLRRKVARDSLNKS